LPPAQHDHSRRGPIPKSNKNDAQAEFIYPRMQ
jgi:hypothetical protein